MSTQTNSSITTIFTLINSMIGGAMLTFPVLFQKAGIFTGILVLIVSSIISYKTCRIYVMHLSSKDNDVEDTIKRILGLKWERFFRLITGFYLVLLNIIYLILIVDQIYNIIFFIMLKSDAIDSIAPKDVDHLVFDKFSKQYLSMIMFLPLLALTFMKDLSIVIKLASYGVGSVFIYFAFLIYQFFKSVIDGVDYSQITWVSGNIG
jgi:sodium-coupled neutral amino acid transporter 9